VVVDSVVDFESVVRGRCEVGKGPLADFELSIEECAECCGDFRFFDEP
jgi:hypothetical protein